MVAFVKPTGIDENLDNIENNLIYDNISEAAAGKGHELWKSDLEAKGFMAGYPDDREHRIRSGLVPYSVIIFLKKEIEAGTDLDLLAKKFCHICLDFAYTGRLKLSKDFIEKLIHFKNNDEGFKNSNSQISLILRDWVTELVNKWLTKNKNWSENAIEILKTIQAKVKDFNLIDENSEIIKQLTLLRDSLVDLRYCGTIGDAIKLLEVGSSDSLTLFDVVVNAHSGWRSNEYKITLPKSSLDFYESMNNPFLNSAISSEKKMLKIGLLHMGDNSEVLEKFIKDRIHALRNRIESNPKFPAEVTFTLLAKIAEMLNQLRSEDDVASHRIALLNNESYILNTIKQDANPDVIDAIIEGLS